MKILRVKFDNILIFKEGFDIDFTAQDRILEDSYVYKLGGPISTQHNLALFGINASGKTTALKLLNLAFEIVLNNIALNTEQLPSIFRDKQTEEKGIRMIVYFYKDNMIHKLDSLIKYRLTNGDKLYFYFAEESLKSKPRSTVTSKSRIFDFSSKSNYKEVQRKDLPEDALIVLRDDISIVIRETRNTKVSVNAMFSDISEKMSYVQGSVEKNIINIFDENIEKLERIDDGDIRIEFKNSNLEIKSSVSSIEKIISSGTLRGQRVIKNAIDALRYGGYLLIDELENHLNKELVKMIIGIFNNKELNKNGACLVFTTHYAEILDAFERMDNIYLFVRDENNFTKIHRYSQMVERNEWKKSEVLLTNYIKGTAPKAINILELEDYICRNV